MHENVRKFTKRSSGIGKSTNKHSHVTCQHRGTASHDEGNNGKSSLDPAIGNTQHDFEENGESDHKKENGFVFGMQKVLSAVEDQRVNFVNFLPFVIYARIDWLIVLAALAVIIKRKSRYEGGGGTCVITMTCIECI